MSDHKHLFQGQFGDDSITLVRGLIHVSPIEVKGRHYNWHIAPHVHNNLFQVFVLESGSLTLLQGDTRHLIQGPTFFSVPANVSHGLDMEPGLTGWVISLADATLENMLKLDADIFYRIDEVHITPIDLTDALIADAYTTMHKCISEYNSNLLGKNFALQHLVGMLMVRLYRVLPASKLAIKFSDNTNKIYYRRFIQLVKEANSFKTNVASYAQALRITTGHLNRICQSVVTKSTKEVIIDYYIAQSKSLLLNFELSIADVSYQLHFEDPAYFARLFRKKTGLTPRAFREQVS